MARGGKRKGAGRRPGTPNQITKELRSKINAERLIKELESIALRNKGNPTVKDKIMAIQILLDKVIPDYKSQEFHIAHERNPIKDLSNDHKIQIAKTFLASQEIDDCEIGIN